MAEVLDKPKRHTSVDGFSSACIQSNKTPMIEAHVGNFMFVVLLVPSGGKD